MCMVANVMPSDKETCKRTPQEIYHALQVLQDVCESRDTCTDCPLYNSGENLCVVSYRDDTPAEWVLADPAKIVWRAFE